MALLDQNSCECIKSELDLFSVPPTQTSIEETSYKKFYPISSLITNAPIEFQIGASDQEYLDLQQSYLYLTCRITDGDGSALKPPEGDNAPADKTFVFPINHFFATQFKNVEIILGNTTVSSADTLYPYRSYIETLLSYGNIKDEVLKLTLFSKDTADPDLHDKTVKDDACINKGAKYRYEKTKFSKKIELAGRIHNEIFSQGKLLLNKTELRMKFHRHAPEFSLMSLKADARYNIVIDSAVMHIAHKRIASSVREAHEMALIKQPAKYPVRSVTMKFFTKGLGTSDLSEPNLHTGELPRRVVIGLVSSAAFNGSLAANPINFQSYDLETIQLRKNGTPLPFEQLEMNYEAEMIALPYLALVQGTGRLYKDIKTGITPEDFRIGGCALYVFDISQDGSESNASLIQEGKLSISIKLKKALEETVVIIAYLEREGIIEIDASRNVTYE